MNVAVFEQLEKILKSKRKDKAARYVALDIVRQQIRAAKGENHVLGANVSGLRTGRALRSGRVGPQIVNFIGLPHSIQRMVINYLREGRRIEAVKTIRDASGVGLKEAKDTIENHPSLRNILPLKAR